ncbi:hypothetical protein JCM10908_006605 [Rhodotorula pacifica]|uniref:ANP1/MMN9/VAN1 family protein n=1 Tax=Rhodotorula pacifica TaxID=1495444 RepID=UPI00317168EA
MLPSTKRRAAQPLPLPATTAAASPSRYFSSPSNTSTNGTADSPYTYKDKSLRPHSLRLRVQHALTRKRTLAVLFVTVFLALAWALGLLGPASVRTRTTRGSRVVARDWSAGAQAGVKGTKGGALVDAQGVAAPARFYNETVLILCPMRNAIEHIWHFFHLVDKLTYPRHLLHLAILVSDTTDGTYARALELADERQYGRAYRGERYGRISVFQKDFAADEADSGEGETYTGENKGKERHAYEAQVGRRKLLAKSRTWLLSSALGPEVDWVLWADVDVVDYEPTLVERLMRYATKGGGVGADVVVPNCVWKTYNEMGAYDRNNWIETPESLAMKASLPADQVLIEGYKDHPTYRFNLASLAPSHPSQLSPHNPYLASPSLLLSSLPSFPPPESLPASLQDANTIPETLDLDGVGGCAALVRAEVHREGAVFPAWPSVDHQLETEGFAQLVKALRRGTSRSEIVSERKQGRGRLVGLPGYYVYHGLYG